MDDNGLTIIMTDSNDESNEVKSSIRISSSFTYMTLRTNLINVKCYE